MSRGLWLPSLRYGEHREYIGLLRLPLFDAWREARIVIPLAYLMRCWPIVDRTPAALLKVGETMRDLSSYHTDHLDTFSLCTVGVITIVIDERAGLLEKSPELRAALGIPVQKRETVKCQAINESRMLHRSESMQTA